MNKTVAIQTTLQLPLVIYPHNTIALFVKHLNIMFNFGIWHKSVDDDSGAAGITGRFQWCGAV